jgi:hypothetical protein
VRKFLSAALLLATANLAVAVEVTLVKYDKEKKELTVKEGDEQKVYKLTDKTKTVAVDADGKEMTLDKAAVDKVLGNEKAAGRTKFDITVEKDTITVVKMKGGRKKKN